MNINDRNTRRLCRKKRMGSMKHPLLMLGNSSKMRTEEKGRGYKGVLFELTSSPRQKKIGNHRASRSVNFAGSTVASRYKKCELPSPTLPLVNIITKTTNCETNCRKLICSHISICSSRSVQNRFYIPNRLLTDCKLETLTPFVFHSTFRYNIRTNDINLVS